MPLGVLITAAAVALLLAPMFLEVGWNSEFLPFFLIMFQGSIPLIIPCLILFFWWTRASTRQTLLEIAGTPTPPLRFILSTLLPARWMLLLLSLAVAVVVVWRGGENEGFDREGYYWVFLTLAFHLCQAWFHLPLQLFFSLGTRSTALGLARAPLILFPVHWFPFLIVVMFGARIELVRTDSDYVIGLAIAVFVEIILLIWMHRRFPAAITRHMAAITDPR